MGDGNNMNFKLLMIALLISIVLWYFLLPLVKQAIYLEQPVGKNIEIFFTGILLSCSTIVFYFLLRFFVGLIMVAFLLIVSIVCLLL